MAKEKAEISIQMYANSISSYIIPLRGPSVGKRQTTPKRSAIQRPDILSRQVVALSFSWRQSWESVILAGASRGPQVRVRKYGNHGRNEAGVLRHLCGLMEGSRMPPLPQRTDLAQKVNLRRGYT